MSLSCSSSFITSSCCGDDSNLFVRNVLIQPVGCHPSLNILRLEHSFSYIISTAKAKTTDFRQFRCPPGIFCAWGLATGPPSMLFIGAKSPRQIIFTRNATESINLVALTWGDQNLNSGDVVILSEMEHHANLVPWQILAAKKNLRLEFIPVTPDGLLDFSVFPALLDLNPKLVAFTHVSNVLGTINPAREIIRQAQAAGAVTLVDAAQSIPHFPVNVQDLGADFVAFSGHKMCGPTGIGVLYGRQDLLETMPPFMGGGEMIKRVYLRTFKPNELPHKFEAGTPAIAEAIGLGAAITYLESIGMEAIHAHEKALVNYAMDCLEEIPGVQIVGPTADHRGGVVAFTLDNIHPHDISQILDEDGVAIRAGHHCAMPLHDKLNLISTARASFYLYTTEDEIDTLARAVYKTKKIFGV